MSTKSVALTEDQIIRKHDRSVRGRAYRAYIAQQVGKRERVMRRETDEEIRRVLRAHDIGSPAFD